MTGLLIQWLSCIKNSEAMIQLIEERYEFVSKIWSVSYDKRYEIEDARQELGDLM